MELGVQKEKNVNSLKGRERKRGATERKLKQYQIKIMVKMLLWLTQQGDTS